MDAPGCGRACLAVRLLIIARGRGFRSGASQLSLSLSLSLSRLSDLPGHGLAQGYPQACARQYMNP